MSIFHQAQSPKARKGKIQGGRRVRHSKRLRRTVFRFEEPGPAAGLKLSYDPDDPLFPRRWVLSLNQVILQVTSRQPTQLWEALTEAHRQWSSERFEPISIQRQESRRRIMDEEMRRIEFWDRVARHGVKHHSPLRLGLTERERKDRDKTEGV